MTTEAITRTAVAAYAKQCGVNASLAAAAGRWSETNGPFDSVAAAYTAWRAWRFRSGS